MYPDTEMTVLRTVVMPITGEQRTEIIDKSHYKRMSIFMPTAWTAADITFLASLTKDGTFVKVVKASDESEVTSKASASEMIALDGVILEMLEICPFIKLRSGVDGELVVEDCEDTWNELVDADVEQTVEATDIKTGAGALKWVIAAGMSAGDIIATEIISKDLSAYKTIRLWIKCSVATVAGNLKLLLDAHGVCGSPNETLSIPALVANTWTEVNLTIATPAGCDALISIGMEYDADLGPCTIYVNNVRASKEILQAAARTFNVVLMR